MGRSHGGGVEGPEALGFVYPLTTASRPPSYALCYVHVVHVSSGAPHKHFGRALYISYFEVILT